MPELERPSKARKTFIISFERSLDRRAITVPNGMQSVSGDFDCQVTFNELLSRGADVITGVIPAQSCFFTATPLVSTRKVRQEKLMLNYNRAATVVSDAAVLVPHSTCFGKNEQIAKSVLARE